jgi:hypothetical protein
MTKKQGARYASYVATVIAAIGTTSACDAMTEASAPDAQYGMACISHVTHNRVEDDQCPEDLVGDDGFYDGGPVGNYTVWYPVGTTYTVPAVGQPLTGTPPLRVAKGAPIARGVPKEGATAQSGGMSSIKRGGFGIKSGSVGGKAGAAAGKAGGSGGS